MNQQEQQESIPFQRQINLMNRFQQRDKIFNEWTEQHFDPENSKCEFSNRGQNVCTNPECTYGNPFMCRHSECQCTSHHLGCSSQQIEFISNQMKRESKPTVKLQEEADKVINSFFKELIHHRELFKFRFGLGIGNRSFESQINSQRTSLDSLVNRPVTGKSISQLLKLKNESKVLAKVDQKVENLHKSAQTFIQKRIRPLFKHLQNILLFEDSMEWGPSHPFLRGNRDLSAPLVNTPTKYYMKLISPGVLYITGKIVKCRLRVESATSQIAFGIGLRKRISSSKFKLKKLQDFGCFITDCGQINMYKGEGQSEKFVTGIRIRSKDIMSMEFDTKDWKLKFKNENTDLSFEVKIPFIPEIENDQYHFCVGLTKLTDKVELLKDVEDNLLIEVENNLAIENQENANINGIMSMD